MKTARRCLVLGLAVCLAAPLGLAVPPGLEGNAPPVPGLSSPATQPAAPAMTPRESFNGWSSQDVQRLAESLGDASKIAGINPDAKPLARGFSAGGQVEMILYQQNPRLFGGMVLDAAYPLNVGVQPYQVYAVPPADRAIKSEPILAILGGDDPGARVWNSVAAAWKKAGAPLTIAVVPGRKHEWLFDNDDRQKMLIDWLSDVTAGKLPGAAPTTQPQ